MSLDVADPTDRFLAGFRKLVMLSMPAIKFFAPWSYQVESVNADGSINGSATDTGAGMPDVSHAAILSGVAGATIKPAVGATVIVVFLNGDPQQARVSGFDSNSAQSVTLDTGTGTAEHVITTEAVLSILLAVLLELNPNLTSPIVPDTLLASALGTAASTDLTVTGPLSLAEALLALSVKSGDTGGTIPSVGCKNLRGG